MLRVLTVLTLCLACGAPGAQAPTAVPTEGPTPTPTWPALLSTATPIPTPVKRPPWPIVCDEKLKNAVILYQRGSPGEKIYLEIVKWTDYTWDEAPQVFHECISGRFKQDADPNR